MSELARLGMPLGDEKAGALEEPRTPFEVFDDDLCPRLAWKMMPLGEKHEIAWSSSLVIQWWSQNAM